MRMVIQRSAEAKVVVEEQTVGQIERGLVCLVCFEKGDTNQKLETAAEKLLQLRMFEDPQKKRMDLNIQQVDGQILCVSQFTLSWRGNKGHRPSFDASMPPQEAEILYNQFCEKLRKNVRVETGIFGAKMQVHIVNIGPVTFCLDY